MWRANSTRWFRHGRHVPTGSMAAPACPLPPPITANLPGSGGKVEWALGAVRRQCTAPMLQRRRSSPGSPQKARRGLWRPLLPWPLGAQRSELGALFWLSRWFPAVCPQLWAWLLMGASPGSQTCFPAWVPSRPPDPGGTPREAVPRSSVPEKNLQTGSELPSWPEYPATLLLPQCLIWKET